MIAGIEGHHAWLPPGESAAAVVLGQRVEDDGTTEVWPWFKLRKISGLYSLGDPQDVRDNRVGQDGEIARVGRRRGKTVVYEGLVKGRTRTELLTGCDTLNAAFEDMVTEGTMVCSWHPLNTEFSSAPARYFNAKPLICEIVDEQATRNHERPFVVSLRLSDPNHYEVEA